MYFNAFLLAIKEIRRNVMRAFLTALGIIIGVAAVITMVTVGNGATEEIKAQVSSLGSNLLMIRPARNYGAGPGATQPPNFKLEDVELIREQIAGVNLVAPTASRSVSTVYRQQSWTTSITGVTNDYFTVANWNLVAGRIFTSAEQVGGKAVCIIGATVRSKLFADQDPLGKKLRIKSLSCEIVGLLASKGQSAMGQDQDDMILLPLKTVLRRVLGSNSSQEIPNIMVSAKSGVENERLSDDISQLLRERRNIAINQVDDFQIIDTKQIAQALSSTTETMTTLLGAVAAVSLLVGGIGIMNIMLVSVTERIREIGIRLAIGALEREVMLQFLVEAVVLSTLGGILGILIGLIASLGLTSLMNLPFTFNWQINILAFVFSAAVGVGFGYTPAKRAAKLDPIEALRHE